MRRLLLLSTATLALASCQSKKYELTPLPQSSQDAGVASPRVNGMVAEAQNTSSSAVVDTTSPVAVSAARVPRSAQVGDVSLNFADTDIREIVRQILGEILKVNYTIDPSVRGTATIQTGQPMPKSDLISTLQTLLNQNGASLIQQGSLYRVVPNAVAAASPSLGAGSTEGTQLVSLRYASATELKKVLDPYVGENAKIQADAGHNALIVTGEPASRDTVLGLIRAFDVDLLAGQSYALYPVNSGDPGKVADELKKAFRADQDGALSDIVRVVPMERVNAVLLITSQPRYLQEAQRLFRLIERGELQTARSWHVYYVQNGQSLDLANILQKAFTPHNVTAVPSSAPTTAPGQTESGFSSSGGGASSGTTLGSGSTSSAGGGLLSGSVPTGGTMPGGTMASGSDQGSSPATDALSSSGDEGGGKENAIRIIPNKANNAVLIFATPSEESTIEAMLHKIDILPLQVRIDATIAEVTLNDALEYGTQFSFKGSGVQGLLANVANTTVSSLASTTAGFQLARIGKSGNVQAVLSALADITNVRVLSSPQVMVLDNQSARLLVGDLVPIQTQTTGSTLTSTATVLSSIDYHETGVILEVTPRVNSGGLVSLDISQEVSNATTTNSSTIDSPTFSERKFRSHVAVQDGQTIGIAGMIQDSVSRENAGIPFLKDIPILGSLVSTQTNTRQRTELLVLLTPHVLEDQRQARALTEDLREKLINAASVPEDLPVLPQSGSSNPNARLSR